MSYKTPDRSLWNGRASNGEAYFYEVVSCISLDQVQNDHNNYVALLGYACDEGVKRNLGRVGAKLAPDEIRKRLAKISKHPGSFNGILDLGDIVCHDDDLELVQEELADSVNKILSKKCFPILMGGGHDIAYAHYTGIRQFAGDKSIGIINLDAHFDLRKFEGKGTSGTPFFQIAKDCKRSNLDFYYMCLGVEPLSNIRELYQTARELGVEYIESAQFRQERISEISNQILSYLNKVDYVYLTIDLDGFSAAIAPGVSAPSPFGFDVAIALRVLDLILASKKLISMDVAELNPAFDVDGHTARLAAYLIAYCIQHR